ncbi:MAG: C4-type zinc ribbon domain-containing protein [Bacteroidia bacterium]
MIAVEITNAEERLVELIQLQVLYDRLQAVRQRQGDLPDQIEKLQDKASGLQKRIRELEGQIQQLESDIRALHISNDNLRDLEQKLLRALNQARGEQILQLQTEHQETVLTIQKNIRDIGRMQQKVEGYKKVLAEESEKLREIQQAIAEKQARLQDIQEETEHQMQALLTRIQALSAHLHQADPRLFTLFERRRRALREGKALVPVLSLANLAKTTLSRPKVDGLTPESPSSARIVCSGCYILLPSQLQIELAKRNKLYVCESCGRFLVDAELFTSVRDSMP